jgi:molecular chaperone GrpE (heat shock protein)
MWAWLKRIFCGAPVEQAVHDSAGEVPPWAEDILQALEREPQTPPWVQDLTENAQRAARASGKASLRVEELERKLEGGLADLQRALRDLKPARGAELRWDELLDALDLLDQAAASLPEGAASAGLRSVSARLERFLQQGGMERHAPRGTAPDGRFFQVVGTEEDEDLPEGAVTRVVRAAVTCGERVLREGQVLTNRRT